MIPVFLISDENYAKYAAVTIQSVISGTKEKLAFYFLDGGLSSISAEKIKLMVKKNGHTIEFIKIDSAQFANFPNIAHFSLNTYFRYLIADLKPKIKKAIYIDTDMVICGDIAEIYNTDLSGLGIGAVPYIEEDLGLNSFVKYKRNLGLSENHVYFNAGLLLIDCEYWRKNSIGKTLFEKTAQIHDKLSMPDQDVLNVVFAEKYKILPKQYNLVLDLCGKYLNLPDFLRKTNGCFVLHYTGGNNIRPWLKKDVPYKQYFWNEADKTPFSQDLIFDLMLNEIEHINKRLDNTYKNVYLFNFLPLLKIKEKKNVKKYYLFGFIPFLKIH
jgi:lipopolysaccharide biosynthesis glycosyltransferase